MELTLNLDKIQSDNVSKYAKTILDKQNPYKNFKIEKFVKRSFVKKLCF